MAKPQQVSAEFLSSEPAAVDTLIFINNEISARIARAVIETEGIAFSRIALVLQRKLSAGWFGECSICINYPHESRPVTTWYRRFKYFIDTRDLVRRGLRSGRVKRVLIVNVDNIFSNYVVFGASKQSGIRIDVLVEGIMNFQEILMRNRKKYLGLLKGAVAPLVGLSWHTPPGHLSGIFEDNVNGIYTFAKSGLKAPEGKVSLVALPSVKPRVAVQKDAVLILMTGLHLWMSGADFDQFASSFVRWIKALDAHRLYVKPHPRALKSPLSALLPRHEVIGEGISVEDLAPDIPASRVIGYCCTGLVTLRLMRPDLRCIDYGWDFYCQTAYFGDKSVKVLLESVGCECVPMLSEN